MNFSPLGLLCDHIVKECLKVHALLCRCNLALDLTGGDLQGGKQVQRAVTFVCALHCAHDLAATGVDITAGSLDGLYRRLLIDTEHQGVVRRVEIQANHVGGLGGKFRVGADAP